MINQSSKQFIHLSEAAAMQSPQKALIYIVQKGDTLSQIIYNHYKVAPNTLHYRVAEASVLEFNHHIKDPNIIRASDVIRLMPLPDIYSAGQCLAPKNYDNAKFKTVVTNHRLEPMRSDRTVRIRDTIPKYKDEQDAFLLLSALEQNHGIIAASVGAGVNAFGNLVGQGNDTLIKDMAAIYDDFKAGKMTENQYNYRRQKVVKELAHRMGPLFNSNSIHIDQRKGMVPTGRIDRYSKNLAKMSRYATRGGVVLAGVGVGLGCRDIANTDDRQEKNDIFVETMTGTTVGLLGSYAMTVILVSNPVGWGVAIALGVGTAAVSYFSGKAIRSAYSATGSRIDFVSGLGVDEICK